MIYSRPSDGFYIRNKTMLILTRRRGEAIFINDDIEIRVLGIDGNQTRIGIEAPKNMAVHREEIKRRIEVEKNGGNA